MASTQRNQDFAKKISASNAAVNEVKGGPEATTAARSESALVARGRNEDYQRTHVTDETTDKIAGTKRTYTEVGLR